MKDKLEEKRIDKVNILLVLFLKLEICHLLYIKHWVDLLAIKLIC